MIAFYLAYARESMQMEDKNNPMENNKKETVLAIDRWKKRLWLAYNKPGTTVIFPIGSLDNDDVVLYNIAHLVQQYAIQKIIVWSPKTEQHTTESIETFIKNLSFVISSDCSIEKVNEDFSSVQANAHIGVYKKTAAEDSLAAVYVLEEYRKKENLLP